MTTLEQAREVEALLPTLMRRLFATDVEHLTLGLSIAQLRLARLLMSRQHTISALADELGISTSALTQLADRMEVAGLVERLPSEHDRRQRILQLTPEGQQLMRRRQSHRVAALERTLEAMPAAERSRAIEALHLLLQAAESAALEQQQLLGVSKKLFTNTSPQQPLPLQH